MQLDNDRAGIQKYEGGYLFIFDRDKLFPKIKRKKNGKDLAKNSMEQ